MVEEKQPAQQEQMIQRFTQTVKHLPKVDIRSLIEMVKNDNSGLLQNSPVIPRILTILPRCLEPLIRYKVNDSPLKGQCV